MKKLIISIYQKALSNPTITKAIHTFLQSFLATFVVGISGILGTHSIKDAETALIALVVAALAAALSATKSAVAPSIVSWASSTDNHVTPGQ